ncbi:MAG: arginine--tRNA ligase [Phycisphaerae bacterium]|nr:arginine--tRNA ligase [Phycisphaerae bacterium]
MNLKGELETRISEALVAAGAPHGSGALIARSNKPEFGHYQANGCMAAAKALKTNPRELAQKVVDNLDLSDIAEPLDIAGPGFINIRISAEWLAQRLTEVESDPKLGVAPPDKPQTVVVDYSAPNLAKEMHVGHLRSTIIGDAMVRVLDFIGHKVIRQNHVGDWGTQFGMLVQFLKDGGTQYSEHEIDGMKFQGIDRAAISDLQIFYRQARAKFDADPEFADRARSRVVLLQSGDKETWLIWKSFVDESLEHCEGVYRSLGVLLRRTDVHGESEFNDDLPNVIEDLRSGGWLEESQGAQCVFLDEFRGKGEDDADVPLIVQKSDGGYLYATTDLAGIRYRQSQLAADRVLYVTDSRQGMHFAQVFGVARMAGFAGAEMMLEHVPFGMMLGEDHRPFKAREGDTIRLTDLLTEAQQRAFDLVSEKTPDFDEDRRREIASIVGIGSVKYADLSQNRSSDYVFSWDKMLSLVGNTAPYMQYAYARVKSIFRKADMDESQAVGEIVLTEPAETNLAVKLVQLPETVQAVADECLPNLLCSYLFDLGGAFMTFYEACPVLKADDPTARTSRLMLCLLTARTIKTGLGMLGIDTLEQM